MTLQIICYARCPPPCQLHRLRADTGRLTELGPFRARDAGQLRPVSGPTTALGRNLTDRQYSRYQQLTASSGSV
ncbi:hypothetical protein BaRGS_00028888 [Batillaria attramentaria]|uniref:Uncharacterized protein n=1 Tax=Batillaria attramentaria TaxID=370345 RepID=A0ABD0JYC6_9CAEN